MIRAPFVLHSMDDPCHYCKNNAPAPYQFNWVTLHSICIRSLILIISQQPRQMLSSRVDHWAVSFMVFANIMLWLLWLEQAFGMGRWKSVALKILQSLQSIPLSSNDSDLFGIMITAFWHSSMMHTHSLQKEYCWAVMCISYSYFMAPSIFLVTPNVRAISSGI